MIIVKQGTAYIHVAVACVDSTGAATDPTSAVVRVYSVSQINGALSFVNEYTLTKQDDQTGFYGVAIPLATFTEELYVLLFKLTIAGVNTINVYYFSRNPDLKAIQDVKKLNYTML
jgi:hypothetical protein